MSLARAARPGLALVAIALLWAFAARGGLPEIAAWLSPESLEERLRALPPLVAPLALIGVMALVVVVSPLPSVPVDVAAGAVFGPWLGTLYAALGATLGALIAFGIARALGRRALEPWLGRHIQFCPDCSDALLSRLVLVSRLLPMLSFDLISYGAGLTGMSVRRFALATFAGTLPLTFAYVSLGAILRFGAWTPWLLGALVVIGLLALPRLVEDRDLFGLRRHFRDHLDPPSRAARGA
jgi:uncharacterized membrane protein YdjX (TVP38/TMEM64 family)